VTAQRFGPSLVTQPLPGTETGLSWKLGARPAARRRMTLKLTDVGALDVDARAAKLQTGTITVRSDGPSHLTISRLQRGTKVLEHHRVVARANKKGVAGVRLQSGTTVLLLVRPARSRKPTHHSKSKPPRGRSPVFAG